MNKTDELLNMWAKDSVIDRTEPGKELINIPQVHSKYLTILSKHRLLAKEADFKYNKIKKIKWDYYTGKLDDGQLKHYGWEPFPFVLKSEINTDFDSDEDLNKALANKIVYEEVVEICQSILKELNSRTFQLRDFIQWERFIQGV